MIHEDPHVPYTLPEVEMILKQLSVVEQGLLNCRIGEIVSNKMCLQALYNTDIHFADRLVNGPVN